jgi:hypothetical protein
MNNKYIRDVLLFIILLFLLFLILIIRNSCFSGKKQTRFASLPKKEITRIELSVEERNLILTHEADGWKVNNEHEARKSAVLFMIRILTEMSIKSPVSSELFDNEVKMKGVDPVLVRVYEKRTLLRSFLVFRTRANKYGNIMKVKESSKPFIVSLPGFEGDIGSEFRTDELYWRPFNIFNLRPTEISGISLENLSDTTLSFRISKNGEVYSLSDNTKTLTGWDTDRVRRYISYFTWVPFEEVAGNISAEEKNIIEAQRPLYKLTVMKSVGSETSLTLWERNVSGKIDNDRLWAKMGGRDELLVIRYFDIDPLLKKITYFFTQNNGEVTR